MQCTKHPEHAADGMCAYSGKPYCAAELVDVDGRFYAKDNVGKVLADAKRSAPSPNVFMNAGGAAASSMLVAGRKPMRHWLHVILSICTGGLWIPVYLILLISRGC